MSRLNHRHFVRLKADASNMVSLAKLLVSSKRSGLWVGDHAPLEIASVPMARYPDYLGSDAWWLVFDARSGFNPDAFAALTGIVRGGGVVILITPEAWPTFDDPDYQRFISFGGEKPLHSRFLERMHECSSGALLNNFEAKIGHILESVSHIDHENDLVLTDDQESALDGLKETSNLIKVVVSDRGRGKSTVLGLFSAQMCAENKVVVVTSAKKTHVETLLRHARALGEKPSYIPPDELLRAPRAVDHLIVDEAAAIPVSMLLALVDQYPNIIFATTLHGYEGSGRGFGLKFLPLLAEKVGNFDRFDLSCPVRWAANDPLETWVNDSFMLGVDLDAQESDLVGELSFKWVSKSDLVGNDDFLRAIFAISVVAHYQTTPSDLRSLLDHEALHVMVGVVGDKPVAVIWVLDEGMLPQNLFEDIAAGRRRVAGHLIPQLLAQHDNGRELLGMRVGRVTRIAVHPQWQGRGLGSAALGALHTLPRPVPWQVLGTSFGVTAPLFRFWQKNGYQPARIGVKADAASGAHSIVMLKTGQEQHSALIRYFTQRFGRQYQALKDRVFVSIDESLRALFDHYACEVPEPGFDQELRAFSCGSRTAESVAWSLMHLFQTAHLSTLHERDVALLTAYIQDAAPWATLASDFGLPGRRGVEQALRRIVSRLIES